MIHLDKNEFLNLRTKVMLCETAQGVFDILDMRNRMVLARNLSRFEALDLCKEKGWEISE